MIKTRLSDIVQCDRFRSLNGRCDRSFLRVMLSEMNVRTNEESIYIKIGCVSEAISL